MNDIETGMGGQNIPTKKEAYIKRIEDSIFRNLAFSRESIKKFLEEMEAEIAGGTQSEEEKAEARVDTKAIWDAELERIDEYERDFKERMEAWKNKE